MTRRRETQPRSLPEFWPDRWRSRPVTALLVGVVAAALLAGCSDDGGGDASATTTPTTTTVPAPQACDQVTELFPVAALQAQPDHPCFDWVDQSNGRAIKGSTGSATVWSRRTENETALIVGAVHTLGQGWFGPAGSPIVEAMVDPGMQTGVARLFLLRPDGSGPDELASPWFALYNPAIAAERNGNLMQDVLPREDFYVAVTDNQKLDVSGFPPVPEPIRSGLVPLYDPGGVTLTAETISDASANSLVLLLGYPNETGTLTGAVGRVLSDAEAVGAIATLADLGDAEGNIEYDSTVEIIIEGSAVAGMSGGPAVDREGRLVGVMVRATDDHDGVQYVRAVRMSHVAAELASALDALPGDLQDSVAGYLER